VVEKQATISFVIILFVLITPVLAANTQGFSWGLDEGDRIGYSVTWKGSTSKQFYAVVVGLPNLPDKVTSMAFSVSLRFELENGTAYAFSFPGQFPMVLPMGNWAQISSLAQPELEQDYENVDMNDGLITWGYTVSRVSTKYRTEITVEYLKEDGAIQSYNYEKMELDRAKVVDSCELRRSGGLLPIGTIILSIGVLAVAAIMIIRACRKK